MKDMFECLYERASAHGNRPLTGNDLARIIDEAKREFRKQGGGPAVRVGELRTALALFGDQMLAALCRTVNGRFFYPFVEPADLIKVRDCMPALVDEALKNVFPKETLPDRVGGIF